MEQRVNRTAAQTPSSPYARPNGAKFGRTPMAVAQLVFLIFTAPVLFHYRAVNPTTATTVAQGIIFATSCCAGIFAVFNSSRSTGGRIFWLNITSTFLFVVSAITVAIARGQDPAEIYKNSAPLTNFFFALCVCKFAHDQGVDLNKAWRWIVQFSVAAVVVRFALAIFVRGVDLATARYEILSGAAPLLLAMLVATLLYGRLSRYMPALIANLLLIIMSVTRTYLFMFAATFAFGAIAGARRVINARTLTTAIVAILVTIVGGALLNTALPGSPIERWTERLFTAQATAGFDLTEVSRRAENAYQFRAIRSSADSMLVGQGLGARSYMDADVARPLYTWLNINHDQFSSAAFGHNNFISVIFVGGILFGGFLIYAQIYNVVIAFRMLHLEKDYLLATIPLAYFAYFSFGFFGGTFGDRQVALIFGLCVGMLAWRFGNQQNTKLG
jgi:hypothetical protein